MKVRVLEGLEPLVSSTVEDAELPEGWARVKLPQVARINMGQSPPGVTYNERGEGLPFFQGKADFGPLIPTVRVWCTDPKKIAESGDILMSVRAPVGPTNVADRRCIIGRGLAAISPEGSIPTPFLLYALRLQEKELAGQGAGSTFTAINRDHLADVDIDLPPLAEQKRIVDKVEALLAQVDASRARLAKVPTILKRFRQAVLAAACSGRLTADWRETRPDAESAHEAVRRSREDALRHYEAAGEAARAIGVRKPSRSKMLEPTALDLADLADLPVGWTWTTFEQVARDITVGHVGPMTGEYVKMGVPFLRSLNVREFRFDPTDLKFISPAFHRRLAKSALRPGDVAIVRTGNPGTSCVIPAELPDANCADLVVLRPSTALDPNYACIFLNSVNARDYINDVKVGIAQGHFNIGSMRLTTLPLPPLAEQQEIVRRVEALFKLADAIERRVGQATARAERLTQAVLAKAFRGELVPTEAELAQREGRDYEPASEFLKRVRHERKDQSAGQVSKRYARRRAGVTHQLGLGDAYGATDSLDR